jgi:hypothetical protein
MQRLDAACKDAFGQTLSEFGQAQAADGAVPGMGQIPSFDDFSLDDLTIAVDGDNATVTPNDAPDGEPIHFIRIDGAWKVNASRALMPAEFADLEPMIEPIVALLPQIDAAIGEVIDTVGSGGYVSLQAVTIDLQQKIMPIVMEAMGSMQPPPGGG